MVNMTTARSELNERGFAMLRGAFEPEDFEETRVIMLRLLGQFDQLVGQKARDIGGAGSLTPRQPEIDRPTRLVPGLFKTSLFIKARHLASQLLGGQAHHTFDHFICKMPDSGVQTPWHQDQAYLGAGVELKTVNFWIPFQGVTEQNGTMIFLPGSHKGPLQDHGRTAGHHPHARGMVVKEEEAVVCEMALGDCSVHTPMTVHCASANGSEEPRLAWGLHFNRIGRMAYVTPSNLLATLAARFGK